MSIIPMEASSKPYKTGSRDSGHANFVLITTFLFQLLRCVRWAEPTVAEKQTWFWNCK